MLSIIPIILPKGILSDMSENKVLYDSTTDNGLTRIQVFQYVTFGSCIKAEVTRGHSITSKDIKDSITDLVVGDSTYRFVLKEID